VRIKSHVTQAALVMRARGGARKQPSTFWHANARDLREFQWRRRSLGSVTGLN
jgi:hypothetical protein